jgi:ATPase subunit of ABC transporter with duplicated ATPase domains
MLLSLKIQDKSFNNHQLFKHLEIVIQDHEKIGLIGRNGAGKSSLLNILNQQDKDYDGDLTIKNHAIIISSRQEHHAFNNLTVLEYIVHDLPEYISLNDSIERLSLKIKTDPSKIQQLSDQINRFSDLDYYRVQENIQQILNNYHLDSNVINRRLNSLSGGQVRLIELIKVQLSHSDLALIDEPTNHMDYIAKNVFIDWFKSTTSAVVVVTHDRDVLNQVDRIIEIKNLTNYNFKGNYQSYLKNNMSKTLSEISTYDLTQKQIKNLRSDVIRFRRLKERSRDPGTIKNFKRLENNSEKELEELLMIDKPSFWIDQTSIQTLNDKITNSYHKYKTTNIKLSVEQHQSNSIQTILTIEKLSLGYNQSPLFKNLTFSLLAGQRLRLFGKNGAGKSSLVKVIMQLSNHQKEVNDIILSGKISIKPKLKIGLYEQEINQQYLDLTLENAIENILKSKHLPVSDQRIKQLMNEYLFDPSNDSHQLVKILSGGQKARLQLMSMLIDQPQLLILDEPTNHLDLPSIEELENSLIKYNGSIIYITHDSFFAKKIDSTMINMDNLSVNQ